MQQISSISSLDITATVRPIKLAFLLDASVSQTWLLDEAIPWISSVWGGGNYFFFPISDLHSNDPSFEMWVKLLQKFDPDRIVSTGAFPEDLLNYISSNLLTRAKIFQFNPQAVQTPRLVPRGHQYTIPFEDLFLPMGNTISITEIATTGSRLHDLWFFSHFGRLGQYALRVASGGNGPTINQGQITTSDIELNMEDICIYRYPSSFNESPAMKSLSYLGFAGALEYFDDYTLPHIIVIGETTQDWCLFKSLLNFYPGVRWIPQSFLSNQNNCADHLLYNLATSNEKVTPPIITSLSLGQSNLNTIVQGSLQRVPNVNTTASFSIEMDFNKCISNWIEWGEANNYNEATIIFQGKQSMQKAPLLSPKSFKLDSGKTKFIIDLHTNFYKYLGHTMADEVPIKWPNERSVLKEDARRNFVGGISFNPVSHITFGGQTLESILRGPHLLKKSLFEDLETILAKNSLTIGRTISSMNISSVIKLWDNSLDQFYSDYYESDFKKIFQVFKMGVNAKNSQSIGLSPQAGIGLKKKFLFGYPTSNSFLHPISSLSDDTVDRWLNNGILLRGEKLKCLTCGWLDFYPENQVNGHFACHRCLNSNKRNIISMGHNEPRFLYDLNPLIFGLQESNSDLVLFGAKKIKDLSQYYFEFESEIEIYSSGTSIQEIDLFANLDGRLVIGECKSNGQLRGQQLRDYVTFCRNFHIQKFFCISGSGWSPASKQNIEQAFASLKYLEVIFI